MSQLPKHLNRRHPLHKAVMLGVAATGLALAGCQSKSLVDGVTEPAKKAVAAVNM